METLTFNEGETCMVKRVVAGSLVLLTLAVAGFSIVGSTPVSGAPGIPPLFTDSLVTGVPAPTAMAFTPDGRLLISTQNGTLRVYKDSTLYPTPALSFSSSKLCANGERGLLGVAVDPVFSTN